MPAHGREDTWIQVQVTVIPHYTRKDEWTFRDAEGTKRVIPRDEWDWAAEKLKRGCGAKDTATTSLTRTYEVLFEDVKYFAYSTVHYARISVASQPQDAQAFDEAVKPVSGKESPLRRSQRLTTRRAPQTTYQCIGWKMCQAQASMRTLSSSAKVKMECRSSICSRLGAWAIGEVVMSITALPRLESRRMGWRLGNRDQKATCPLVLHG